MQAMSFEEMEGLAPSEAVLWRRARADFEAGVGVPELCRRYGLKRSTAYGRAQAWRAAQGREESR